MPRLLTRLSLLAAGALLMGCGNAGVWLQTWWGPLDTGPEQSPFPPGGAYQVQGFVHRVSTDPALTGEAARDLVEVMLVGADQDVSCDAYTRYLLDVAEVQSYLAEVLALSPANRPPDFRSYACQELDGAARDAFGGTGVYRAVHTLLEITGNVGPSDGVFLASPEGGSGADFEGAELLGPGSYVTRIFERSQHGEGILPEQSGGSATWQVGPERDIDPAEDCVNLLGALVEDWDTDRERYPDRASVALSAATHRYYHHYMTQETIEIKGAERPLGVVLPAWTTAAEQGADVELTLFGQVSRVPPLFPFQQVLVSTQGETVPLTPCPRLSEVAGMVWPELHGLPGGPMGPPPGDDDSAGDDDDSVGDDDDSAS